MKRVLEAEVMDDAKQVDAYARADFEAENQGFVDRFVSTYGNAIGDGPIIDLGCGPGDILIRLARALPTVQRFIGIDASPPMIDVARRAVSEAGLDARIELRCERAQDVSLPAPCAAIVSNSLVHHLPNPLQFWYAVTRLGRPGTPVFVMDLCRPDSEDEARAIVETYAAKESEQLRRDFFNSLCAALTEDDVAAHLAEMNCRGLFVDVVDDRHWMVEGTVTSFARTAAMDLDSRP